MQADGIRLGRMPDLFPIVTQSEFDILDAERIAAAQ
jgi:hypothetical protein